jgi:DNA-binding CsgD family transcriptional regulator
MSNVIKKIKQIAYLFRHKSSDLRVKMMLYFVAIALTTIGFLVVILAWSGRIFNVRAQMASVMTNHLNNQVEKATEEITQYTAYGIELSRSISKTIDDVLEEYNIEFYQINNNPEVLETIQNRIYQDINTVIRLGGSSGAYAFVDSTINTAVPDSAHSKAGVYLKLANVTGDFVLNPEIAMYRGSSEIARKNGVKLHTLWNLEFNTNILPGYDEIMKESRNPGTDYYWTGIKSPAGAEDSVLLLCVPITGNRIRPYGLCGVDLNEKHFSLQFPATDTAYGSMVTVITPYYDSELLIEKGMTGNTEGTWLDKTQGLHVTEGKYFNAYGSTKEVYYGLSKELSVKALNGRKWVVSVLIPREGCVAYIRSKQTTFLALILGFTLAMLSIALYLSNRFVKPILAELDKKEGEDMPADLKELFDSLTASVKTLTRAEYSVYEKYLEGYDISQIPDVLMISANTVKKHNKSIYKKLNVSSFDELSLYFDLFRRCNRIDDLRKM